MSNTSGLSATATAARFPCSDRRCGHTLHAFEDSVMSLVALLKYAVAALCVGLWGYGLVDQLDSSASTATYLTITALLVAVARL